jgi:natural product precursor
MMKKTMRKLELHKESIRRLDPQEMEMVAGGATSACTHTTTCTDSSCAGTVCP